MSMERIIRPFLGASFSPPFLIPQPDLEEKESEVKSFGSEGGTTFSYSYSFSGTAKSSGLDDWKETSRKSEPLRITNPDDSEQYIETERAKSIQFNDTKTGKKKRSYNFNYPDGNVG